MSTAYFGLKILRRKRNRQNKNMTEKYLKKYQNKNTRWESVSCRICLKKGKIFIYGDSNNSDLTESIKIFGDIELCAKDGFPEYLCEKCFELLQKAISFRMLAKETDALLQKNKIKNEKCPQLSQEIYSDDDEKEHSEEIKHDLDHSQDIDNDQSEDMENDHSEKINIKFKNCDNPRAHKISKQHHKQHRKIKIQCSVCEKILTVSSYKKHLASHDSSSHLICEVCGKMFRKDNLMRHTQLHSKELPYHCQLCPYKGRYNDYLKLHMRTHTGFKPHSCDKCRASFTHRSNLTKHLLIHNKERPFKCSDCEKGFYTKKDVEAHIKSVHIGLKEFECKICGNKYARRKGLVKHEKAVHKRKKMQPGGIPLYLRAEYKKD